VGGANSSSGRNEEHTQNVLNSLGESPNEKNSRRWDDNIKMDLKGVLW
jgi:hypothetical protein